MTDEEKLLKTDVGSAALSMNANIAIESGGKRLFITCEAIEELKQKGTPTTAEMLLVACAEFGDPAENTKDNSISFVARNMSEEEAFAEDD